MLLPKNYAGWGKYFWYLQKKSPFSHTFLCCSDGSKVWKYSKHKPFVRMCTYVVGKQLFSPFYVCRWAKVVSFPKNLVLKYFFALVKPSCRSVKMRPSLFLFPSKLIWLTLNTLLLLYSLKVIFGKSFSFVYKTVGHYYSLRQPPTLLFWSRVRGVAHNMLIWKWPTLILRRETPALSILLP